MTTVLAASDVGFDYSYARPSLTSGRAAGAKFAIRYSAGAASNPNHPSHRANAGKLITPSEFRSLLAAGYDPIANDEWYETRITEGAAAGHADGYASGTLWHSCGLARGASIYVSWDAAPVSSLWSHADAFLAAFQYELDRWGYHVDAYAGTPYLRHLLAAKRIRYGWRPNAGSWSNDGLRYQPDTSTAARRASLVANARTATPAAIWQTGNYWFSKSADENMLLRATVGSHLQQLAKPAPAPKPAPTPGPVVSTERRPRMIVCRVDPATIPSTAANPGWFTFDGNHVRHLHATEGAATAPDNNARNLMAGLGQASVCTVGFGQYTEWKAAEK